LTEFGRNVADSTDVCKDRAVDALDRRIAVALQLNGRATWRQVARVLDTSESTVARRGRQLLESGTVRVTGQPDPARAGLGYPVLVQLNCESGATKAVARSLAARPDVRFLAIVTSTFDIVLELIVPSRRHLARVLVDEFAALDGITRTTTDAVMRTFKTSYDWSRGLLGTQGVDPSFAVPRPPGPAQGPASLDEVDLQLMQLLGDDGRRTYAELAQSVGISESMVRRRVSALVDDGTLNFATLVDPRNLGFEIEAFVLLRVNHGELERIAKALTVRREVRYVSATSGFSDLACEVILRSPDDLYEFTTDGLGALKGVQSTVIAHELVTVKRAYMQSPGGFWGEDAPAPRPAPRRSDDRRPSGGTRSSAQAQRGDRDG
jgi:DNA-binding Lrp family transcriptional regulator